MRLAYCDDEEIQLEYMHELCEEWAAQAAEPLTYCGYRSAKEMLFENAESYPFDLLLLDIDMEEMSGMELARCIRKRDDAIPIIFLTNRREYVFEGYEVRALRYLLKPIDKEKLFPVLDGLCAASNQEKGYLIIPVAGEMIKLEQSDILYAEANGHYVTIHTAEEDYEIKKPIRELADEISHTASGKENFIFSHRSFLVNLAHIERVMRADCLLSDDSRIPVSRNCYKGVNEAFIRYYQERNNQYANSVLDKIF